MTPDLISAAMRLQSDLIPSARAGDKQATWTIWAIEIMIVRLSRIAARR